MNGPSGRVGDTEMTTRAAGAQGLNPGDILQDTYRIDALLGEGGMGATFRGTNLATGDTVAIKVMTAEFARVPKAVDLFKREARLLRTVRSDAVIRYETTLQDKQGRIFLIMEFISGNPLAHYLARGARLTAVDLVRLGLRLAEGLDAIHRLGIVHRDIAPDNIMIPDDDVMKAKLIDFGLASDSLGTEKSIIGDTYAGKFSFSAPEQFGLAGGKVGPATDIYSLALVLLKVAGLPVPGEGAGIGVVEHRRTDLVLPSDTPLPPVVKSSLERMLRLDPAQRPQEAVSVLSETLSILQGNRPQSGTSLPPMPDDEAQPAKRSAMLPVAAGVVVLVLVGGGVFGWKAGWFGGPSSPAVSQGQAAVAKELVAAEDPLAEIRARIDQGGADNLNAAFGGLMAVARDSAHPVPTRQDAYLMMAEMYDPATFDAARSPFREPDANAARRQYQAAADLGSDRAKTALERLKE